MAKSCRILMIFKFYTTKWFPLFAAVIICSGPQTFTGTLTSVRIAKRMANEIESWPFDLANSQFYSNASEKYYRAKSALEILRISNTYEQQQQQQQPQKWKKLKKFPKLTKDDDDKQMIEQSEQKLDKFRGSLGRMMAKFAANQAITGDDRHAVTSTQNEITKIEKQFDANTFFARSVCENKRKISQSLLMQSLLSAATGTITGFILANKLFDRSEKSPSPPHAHEKDDDSFLEDISDEYDDQPSLIVLSISILLLTIFWLYCCWRWIQRCASSAIPASTMMSSAAKNRGERTGGGPQSNWYTTPPSSSSIYRDQHSMQSTENAAKTMGDPRPGRNFGGFPMNQEPKQKQKLARSPQRSVAPAQSIATELDPLSSFANHHNYDYDKKRQAISHHNRAAASATATSSRSPQGVTSINATSAHNYGTQKMMQFSGKNAMKSAKRAAAGETEKKKDKFIGKNIVISSPSSANSGVATNVSTQISSAGSSTRFGASERKYSLASSYLTKQSTQLGAESKSIVSGGTSSTDGRSMAGAESNYSRRR